VRTESKKMQFLYADGDDAHFMDSETFDQLTIPESSLQDVLRWVTPSSEVEVLLVDDEPSDVQLPTAVDLEVAQTDPGVRGDTASGGGTKPATLETGAIIQVPLFVESGQRIRVDTRSGEYVARA
jgi:elongation factor P